MEHAIAFTGLIFFAAVLYSSVGHGGASAYLAIMALWGVPVSTMRPTALALNILVAGIGTARFVRAGCFSARVFWPFAIASIPAAFVAGAIHVPTALLKTIIGAALLFASIRLLWSVRRSQSETSTAPSAPTAFIVGAGIGFLAGLTGTGGGIFLSPLLLLCRWTTTRVCAGISAAFVLVNSIAGLAGQFTRIQSLPPSIGLWAVAAGCGGLLGSALGSRYLPPRVLRALLATVLAVAGVKLIAT